MLKAITRSVAILGLTASLAACYTPGERAVGGALIGGAAGAGIGAAIGGGRGAAIGAGVGAATGAIAGASTAPAGYAYDDGVSGCPYGAYRDAYGYLYCR
jgi:outer membrane lipoprotein SlyB